MGSYEIESILNILVSLLVVFNYVVLHSLSIQNGLSCGEGLAVDDNKSLLNVPVLESSVEINRIYISEDS